MDDKKVAWFPLGDAITEYTPATVGNVKACSKKQTSCFNGQKNFTPAHTHSFNEVIEV
jgi:hypothetical protein